MNLRRNNMVEEDELSRLMIKIRIEDQLFEKE